ncbi:MAG: 2-C-methyl-D-erythritol 4-phosphate cytidylyltransferase [Desulfobulbaceae bacterium]|nr:2-C-methyl-D-erythritol 4-phosphate cytidylyltransferase [Desulfobulbaceae bacterium]
MSDPANTDAAVIIPAAGSGSRMELPLPKQFIRLGGEPILVRTIRCFLGVKDISRIVVAVSAEHVETTRIMLRTFLSQDLPAKLMLISGGRTRQDSVLAGLRALPAGTGIVLVHDGARPFVSREVIKRCLDEAVRSGTAIAAVPVRDTIKHVDQNGLVRETVDRRDLWQAQTPQAARRELLDQAYELALEIGYQGTDEASLLEHAGYPVTVVRGSEYNIKITLPDDLKIAEGLLEDDTLMKIGHGFDAHRFGHGRQLILGGVIIPFDLGLEGHSDADVVTHALIDALLGAMGEGDIGRHFPDKDPQYKNISSLKLLEQVTAIMKSRKLSICNADLTVVCQRPRLMRYIEEMRGKIAAACNLEANLINIKATSTEMMGFTGRGEGIAAHAVVLLQSVPDEAASGRISGNAD